MDPSSPGFFWVLHTPSLRVGSRCHPERTGPLFRAAVWRAASRREGSLFLFVSPHFPSLNLYLTHPVNFPQHQRCAPTDRYVNFAA
jgi:hypothetical protein